LLELRLERGGVADEADAVLAHAPRPREEHRDEPLGILEVQRRRVFYVVALVAQASGPSTHRGRQPRNVEQLVSAMGAGLEQHAAASGGAGAPPRCPPPPPLPPPPAPRVGRHPLPP